MTKRNDLGQGEKTDKAHGATNQGPLHVAAEHPATVHTPPQTNTEQRPRTDKESHRRRQAVTGPPLAEEPPPIIHPPPTDTKQHPATATTHLQTARESPQVAEEPPATVSIEDLETDDIVIAYVIYLSTLKCLT
jgi:hypothetical protein